MTKPHPSWAEPGATVTVIRSHEDLNHDVTTTAVVERHTATQIILSNGDRYVNENRITSPHYVRSGQARSAYTSRLKPHTGAPLPPAVFAYGSVTVTPTGRESDPLEVSIGPLSPAIRLALTAQQCKDLAEALLDQVR